MHPARLPLLLPVVETCLGERAPAACASLLAPLGTARGCHSLFFVFSLLRQRAGVPVRRVGQ
jgi:hypothetical protein